MSAMKRKTGSRDSLGRLPRILLVDDNASNRNLVVKVLKGFGYNADKAEDGARAVEALVQAERLGRPYDLILMDCRMPVLDGLAATRAIRCHPELPKTREKPIVAMTANASGKDREKCLGAGMNGYLSKPFRLEELNAVLERWLYANDCPHAAQEPVSTPSTGTWDRRVLQRLVSDSESGMLELVDASLDVLGENLEALQQTLVAEDYAALSDLIHGFRGSLAMMGATNLSAHLWSMERALANCNYKALDEQMLDARRLAAELRREMAAWIRSVNQGQRIQRS